MKAVVAELADDLAARDGHESPSVALRDWWREHRLDVARAMLEAINVEAEELVAERGGG